MGEHREKNILQNSFVTELQIFKNLNST